MSRLKAHTHDIYRRIRSARVLVASLPMDKSTLRHLLKSFLRDRTDATGSAISLQEDLAPENDPYDDYALSYRAVIEPSSPDKCRVEIWLSDTGHVAIGIEKWERLANRLALRTSKGVRFAAGHEPTIVSAAALLALLQVISNGEISISYGTILRRLLDTSVVIAPNGFSALQESGYQHLRWISKIADRDDRNGFPQSLFGGIARYQPW